jgi:hypothetical protein
MNFKKTRFHDEWFAVYGYEMPPHVERLSIGQIQEAIEFGRKKHQPVTETIGNDDDLKVWDGHKEF